MAAEWTRCRAGKESPTLPMTMRLKTWHRAFRQELLNCQVSLTIMDGDSASTFSKHARIFLGGKLCSRQAFSTSPQGLFKW
mmetsp:Transcript_31738/g.50960  ORF Transcript_31738/g.50960 Transcript_31738/m.50960 type:complete len:81 (+) Transcript_31738:449-691(+)